MRAELKQELKNNPFVKKAYNLKPFFDTANSFYSKAIVFVFANDYKELVSYNTTVAKIEKNKAVVFDTYSHTTLRHIKEFLKQNSFKAETKKQIENDYKVRI